MNSHLSFNEITPFFLSAIAALGVCEKDIKKQPNDIFCKCPICGDSRLGNKKRLHLYQKGEVINVNCFNGDCQVKNYTPYRFFKEFHQRTFNEFRNFYRKRFLLEIREDFEEKKKPAENSGNLESLDATKMGLDLFAVAETQPVKSHEGEILTLVEKFQFTGDDEVDFENFKKLAQGIKAISPEALAEFRVMLKS